MDKTIFTKGTKHVRNLWQAKHMPWTHRVKQSQCSMHVLVRVGESPLWVREHTIHGYPSICRIIVVAFESLGAPHLVQVQQSHSCGPVEHVLHRLAVQGQSKHMTKSCILLNPHPEHKYQQTHALGSPKPGRQNLCNTGVLSPQARIHHNQCCLLRHIGRQQQGCSVYHSEICKAFKGLGSARTSSHAWEATYAAHATGGACFNEFAKDLRLGVAAILLQC